MKYLLIIMAKVDDNWQLESSHYVEFKPINITIDQGGTKIKLLQEDPGENGYWLAKQVDGQNIPEGWTEEIWDQHEFDYPYESAIMAQIHNHDDPKLATRSWLFTVPHLPDPNDVIPELEDDDEEDDY
jgi:hypothetical protein